MKYTPDIVEAICQKLATGDHRIADVCQQVGISEQTFYRWKEEKGEFCEALKKAETDRLAAFVVMARSGLAKLLDVYEYEETTTEYIDGKDKNGNSVPKIKSRKVTKKRIMPNATAVIFALKNREPEEWKDKRELEVRDVTEPLTLTDEELARIAAGQ